MRTASGSSHPTVSELAGDTLSEVSGWDGKFAATIRTLIKKPGQLTRQWLDGRRASFISPVRLYLTASVLFFVLQAAAPDLDGDDKIGPTSTASTQSNPERVAAATEKVVRDNDELTAAERDSALASAEKAPALLRPLLRRLISDPEGWRASLRSLVPRTFFALLPVYAGILALFYRRRHFPEHLYFAIHLHAFVFIALAIAEIAKFTYQASIAKVVGFAMMLWIVAYALRALKNVYGGSWTATTLKGVGIMTLYMTVGIPALFLTIYLAAFV